MNHGENWDNDHDQRKDESGDAVAQMVKSERNGGFSSSINWQRVHRI